ncbi:MAG: single-stranded DNA-binding protein [Streptococcus hyointestinalis]|nr:single-stranded DNA-binding protein [Streptococcus hyointestinalis]MDD6383941.1 single-stranded DNA-binding protein [Streptococcus hyointestinalis]
MINQSVLVGRLTKDVELRYTPSNQAVATFTLAVNRNFKNQNGDYEADFINCVMWRQQAENIANWTQKGMLVGITGRIQTRNYENQQGQRVYVTEVVGETFQVMESRKDQQGGQNQGGYSNPSQATQNFARDNSEPFGNSSPMDISEDDLPF